MGDSMLAELYDLLEADPSNIFLLERLVEAWAAQGDMKAAVGHATDLARVDPGNRIAQQYLGKSAAGSSQPKPRKTTDAQDEDSRIESQVVAHRGKGKGRAQAELDPRVVSEGELVRGYQTLRDDAEIMSVEINAILSLLRTDVLGDENPLLDLADISAGRISSVVGDSQPRPAREVAREIKAAPSGQQDLINADFEDVVRWGTSKTPALTTDEIREKLVKRKTLLEAILPTAMTALTTEAMTHVERQFLQRKYVNSETMYGDRVEDIPRANFFVSEDNYAWDMEELAAALESNSGVMRNPLSREMFSETDIRAILAHPHGRRLRPLQYDQSKLKKGVRPKTIEEVAKLGNIMLADQSADMAPSRQAMDEFLAYVATLPESEQKTINSLKIEGRDSFSRQPFDYTIGQAVQDAKANVTCFHKTGDFLKQAAAFLQRC